MEDYNTLIELAGADGFISNMSSANTEKKD